MSNHMFYVTDENNKLVSAKFLIYNDQPVVDPNTTKAKATPLYDSNGHLLSTQNEDGYLIVPEDYSLQNALSFAKTVSNTVSNNDQIKGLFDALDLMIHSFSSNAHQDLQTTYNGKSEQPFVKAFTDAASFHLGVVMAHSDLPLFTAEIGGGLYNIVKSADRILHRKSPLAMGWVAGLSPDDAKSLRAGYELGLKLPESLPSPASDVTPPHAAPKTSSVKTTKRDIYDIAMAAGGGSRFGTGIQETALKHGNPSPGGFAPVAMARPAPLQRFAPPAPMEADGGAAGSVTRGAVEAQTPGSARAPGSRLGPKYRKILDEAKALAAAAQAKRGGAAAPPLQGRGLAEHMQQAGLPKPPHAMAGGLPVRMARGGDDAPPLRSAAGDEFGGMPSLSGHGPGGEGVSAPRLQPEPFPPQGAAPLPGMAAPGHAAGQAPITQETLAAALDEYFYQQSRLAPVGGPGFNPALTPLWAGVKIPG